jgi:RND family efflux transporter MFP subunit
MSASSLPRPTLPHGGRWLGSVALLGLVLVVGCGPAAKPKVDKAVEVVVTTPISQDVLDYQDFTGRLDAFRTVDVRPRASGYILSAPFKEGDRVTRGEVLFEIDTKLYQADARQAKANVELAIADHNLQKTQSLRARQLITTRAMGKEEYDQIMASREKSQATVGAMEAAQERADVKLGYCKVTSPLTGRISRRNVDPGNLVKEDDTLLTTVVADDQVYAYFDVDERTYLDLVQQKTGGSSRVRLEELRFPVLMRLANEEEFTHPGTIDFLDNRLNANTGTIRMRGVFENPNGVLKSGLFVRVRLPIGSFYKSILILDEALQSDQGRKYVFVVNNDGIVKYRPVSLGQAIGQWRVLRPAKKDEKGNIVEGVAAGEQVIVSGMQRVRSEQEVKTKELKPQPKAPDFPLGKLMQAHLPASKSAAPRQGDKETRRQPDRETGTASVGTGASSVKPGK